jgi:hypothetical protein
MVKFKQRYQNGNVRKKINKKITPHTKKERERELNLFLFHFNKVKKQMVLPPSIYPVKGISFFLTHPQVSKNLVY